MTEDGAPSVLLTQIGKEAALEGLRQRRELFMSKPPVDNSASPAGSPMVFQCRTCNAPIIVGEDYETKPTHCMECQALIDLGWMP